MCVSLWGSILYGYRSSVVNEMKNEFEIRGDVTVIKIHSQKYGSMETLISTNKLAAAMEFPNLWCARKDVKTGNFYVYGRISKCNKQINYMLHRWITSAEGRTEVDHLNHSTLDNTDENLRVVSVAENQQNRAGPTKRSKSGVRGVYWHKQVNKWCAQIRVNGRKIDVGYFTEITDAANAINEVKKVHTPMSYDIFQIAE